MDQLANLAAMRSSALALLIIVVLEACAGSLPGPRMPATLSSVPASEARAWARASHVAVPFEARFRWSFRDDKGAAKGPGAIVIVPPDSLRFDFRGPLGSGSGAAFVVGDDAVWAVPEERVKELVPNYPLLWAMLGQVRPPAPGASVTFSRTDGVEAWRYVLGADTVDYVIAAGPPRRLMAEVRHAGELVGHAFTTFDSLGQVATSRLDVPERPARLDLRFYRQGPPDSLPASLWSRPEDDS